MAAWNSPNTAQIANCHVLLPFYSTKKGGSGLGLPLCREIIDAHGGRLSLEQREGGGIAVRCWLPGG